MIGRLTGHLVDLAPDGLGVIDVNGVGYEIHVPLCFAPQALGQELLTVYVHTHVREDVLALYGFATALDRQLFRALISVASVGPKLAFAILNKRDAKTLATAIIAQDKTALKGISGVGKRIIDRIFLDLPSKLEALNITDVGAPLAAQSSAAPTGHRAVLLSALVNMGYKANDVERVLSSLPMEESSDVQALLRDALARLTG